MNKITYITPKENTALVNKHKGLFGYNKEMADKYGRDYVGYADGTHYVISYNTSGRKVV